MNSSCRFPCHRELLEDYKYEGYRTFNLGKKGRDDHMTRDLACQLRYLGVIPQAGCIQYGFQIEDSDKKLRLVVLEIEDGVFQKKELMFQEAPDLCYQKVLSDLGNETADSPIDEHVPVTASDIAHYREMHPTTKQRKHFQREQK
jgi:hypothetical protein